jgi:RNA polymerase sigma-70 factor (ECF subfamily)
MGEHICYSRLRGVPRGYVGATASGQPNVHLGLPRARPGNTPYLDGQLGVTYNGLGPQHYLDMEKELLTRVREFEQSALAEAYDQHSTELFRYAVRLLGDPDLAEECVAETFSRFLHAVHGGGGPKQHMRAYLYRVAHNWITDRYRRQPPPSIPLEDSEELPDTHDAARAAERRLEGEQLRAAMVLLTPDQRQVVVLKFLEGWHNEEIGRALGKSVGSVKALQHRALAALQRTLLREDASR